LLSTTALADPKPINENNQKVIINQCPTCNTCQPKTVTKWRTAYKDKIVYRDRIVEKPVIKYVEKIKVVEKPVIKYVDKPRVVVKTKVKTRVKKRRVKIEPPKNGLSLFAMTGEDRLEVTNGAGRTSVKREETYDVGLMYQRDYSRARFSLGLTTDADIMLGLGLNW
jgi:hypothetical protein